MTVFAAHFTPAEFTRKADRPATAAEVDRAAQLSHGLELIRYAITAALERSGIAVPPNGEPLILTSWIRSGNDESQHSDGTAVDVRPSRKLSQRAIYDAVTQELRESGVTFGQCIFYPFSDWHIHYSLATGSRRNQILIASSDERDYFAPTAELIASLPTTRSLVPPRTVGNVLLVASLTGGLALLGSALTA